jgi:hypothetical protein
MLISKGLCSAYASKKQEVFVISIRDNLVSFLFVVVCAALASVVATLLVLGSPGYAVTRVMPDPRLEPVLQHVAVDAQGNVVIQGVNVIIKAQNNSSMQSGGDSRIAAGSNMTVTGGTSATLQASTNLNLKGGANAALQAGNTTIIKGTIVKIN